MPHPIYKQFPLPSGSTASIRLLRIQPNPDETADVECQLVLYPGLGLFSTRAHLYEALSYVWGSASNPQSIRIDGHHFPVTANLHAALLCLRDAYLERLIWVDAICINQGDDAEKATQVQLMARIYAQARNVIVWLGPATPETSRALEVVQTFAAKKAIRRE